MSRFITTLIIIAFLTPLLKSQNITWVKDTIFNHIEYSSDILCLKKQNNVVFITKNGIYNNKEITEVKKTNLSNTIFFVLKDTITYILDENMKLLPENGLLHNIYDIELNSGTLRKSIFTYNTRDSSYIVNLSNGKTIPMKYHGNIKHENDRYIAVKQYDYNNINTYIIDADKSYTAKIDNVLLNTNNEYYIGLIEYDGVAVLNLKGEKIIDKTKGYFTYQASNNICMILDGPEPNKYFIGSEKLKLSEHIKSATYYKELNHWVLKTNKYSLMNDEGEMVYDYIFDNYNTLPFSDKITFFRGKKSFLIDQDGSILLQGEYDEITWISENRYAVKIGYEWFIVDADGNRLCKASSYGVKSVRFRYIFNNKLIEFLYNSKSEYFSLNGDTIGVIPKSKEEVGWYNIGNGYYFPSLDRLSIQQKNMLNPAGVWIQRSQEKKPKERLVNHFGEKLTPWISVFRNTPLKDHLAAITKNKNVGIIRITE